MKKFLLFVASLFTATAMFADPSAAPTAPTVPADQVKAVYSETYSADCGFGEWGSGTAYTQETVGKKYVTAAGGYFGLTYETLNCAKMEKLHLDVYSEEAGSFRVVPIVTGQAEAGVTKTITASEWNSIDIDLADFKYTDWTGAFQIKIDNAPNMTMWMNNIYYYTTQAPEEDTEAPKNFTAEVTATSFYGATITAYAEDNSGVVIYEVYEGTTELLQVTGVSGQDKVINVGGLATGTATKLSVVALDEAGNENPDPVELDVTTKNGPAPATAPTQAADDVISLFSNAYTQAKAWNVGGWGQTTTTTEVSLSTDDQAIFCSTANYLGWELQGGALDCSEMTTVHFDVWVENDATIEFTPIWGSEALKKYTLTAGWNAINEDLANWADINLANIIQLKWANMPTECFIDNVYFYKKAAPASITVNVEVPEGTPACAFYGALSGNAWADMTKVDDTHYTITFEGKTAADLDWGYKFAWESGNWNTQVSPETTYTVTDGSTIVIPGWQTQPGTSYHYTTYTEWNIKFAPAWEWVALTQVESSNVWTADITWGGVGMNVGSCTECPIKKDWFPASDITGGSLAEGTAAKVTFTVVDDETVTIEITEIQTSADEESADAKASTYKVVENGRIVIVTPAGKFDLLGAPIK